MDGLFIRTVTITPDLASRVLETAIEAGHTHGIGYWADVERVRRRADRIVALIVTDRDEDDPAKGAQYDITIGKVAEAVEAILQDPAKCHARGFVKQLLTDDLDGPLSDAIVQVACFGEVKYS